MHAKRQSKQNLIFGLVSMKIETKLKTIDWLEKSSERMLVNVSRVYFHLVSFLASVLPYMKFISLCPTIIRWTYVHRRSILAIFITSAWGNANGTLSFLSLNYIFIVYRLDFNLLLLSPISDDANYYLLLEVNKKQHETALSRLKRYRIHLQIAVHYKMLVQSDSNGYFLCKFWSVRV